MQPMRAVKRQSALHMFASEYGESTLSEKGSGEFDPSFVVTKLGSRVNRVIVAGLLERIDQCSYCLDFDCLTIGVWLQVI